MTTNIWQRLADRLEPHTLVGESGKISALMALRNVCIAMAAEDAEREGREARIYPCAAEGCDVLRNVAEGGTTFTVCDKHWPIAQPTPPAPSLPPLDAGLVEECARVYDDAPDTRRSGLRAAITHYRERVERPLREELHKTVAAYCVETRVVAEARAEADRLRGELADMEKRKDGAYEERNRVVALLAALYPSKRCRTAIEGWSDDWHGCVYIETPEGQLSWHYHDSQASMFAHVPEGAASWDGHTTEEKYRRVDRLCVNAAPAQRFTQPTDEERQRLADMARYYGGQGASSLVYVRADDMRRIATILEQPARRHARKSLGRRFVLRFEDGEISTRTHYDLHSAEVCASAAGAEIIACDLVPVAGEK